MEPLSSWKARVSDGRSALGRALAMGAALAVCASGVACDEGSEPAQVHLQVVASGADTAAFTTDEGYTVELSALRVALADLELTVEGEAHAGLLAPLSAWLLPTAHAHPGHLAGGEVTGELAGRFIYDAFATAGRSWGAATLLPGAYTGMNFTFTSAGPDDGLAADDPLFGHTAWLAGTARRDGVETPFAATLDVDEGTQMVGGVFELLVDTDSAGTLRFEALMIDPSAEQDTLLDGVDFAAEATAAGTRAATIVPGRPAHNILRRRLQVHDHWRLSID